MGGTSFYTNANRATTLSYGLSYGPSCGLLYGWSYELYNKLKQKGEDESQNWEGQAQNTSSGMMNLAHEQIPHHG